MKENKIEVEESLMNFLTIDGGIVNIAIAGKGTTFSQDDQSSSIDFNEMPQSTKE